MDTKDRIILVIEDEKPLMNAIKTKFENEGYSVLTARTVEQSKLYLEDPDIGEIDAIWVDHYLLGKENGLDFVAHLKEGDKWNKIPVFVVSNSVSDDKRQSYITLGVTRYYTKTEKRLSDIVADVKSFVEEGVD
ncbi:MAG: response regulator [Candidatus Jacksonbacteria bacterium]|jgi:DNA-binding response OmpR family regulator|nr:response regulator [Candidatus Jacksonbacteria bacterium]MBT6034064.1 response regulator [Candidatus Jacksonbacteria bacterium]MBT6301003.1 response regulator [Candidatus Jacksonbacteria bacterium]MBT6757184.1 response regulator [Candidatus Jacksonbacteria bacterium]MBT6954831.1 response regulator [Candidatus Jacksonbacteria bacterium]